MAEATAGRGILGDCREENLWKVMWTATECNAPGYRESFFSNYDNPISCRREIDADKAEERECPGYLGGGRAACCDADGLCNDGDGEWCCGEHFYCSTSEARAAEKNGRFCPGDEECAMATGTEFSLGALSFKGLAIGRMDEGIRNLLHSRGYRGFKSPHVSLPDQAGGCLQGTVMVRGLANFSTATSVVTWGFLDPSGVLSDLAYMTPTANINHSHTFCLDTNVDGAFKAGRGVWMWLTPMDVPLGVRKGAQDGHTRHNLRKFHMWFDINLSNTRAHKLIKYLVDGLFIDENTADIRAQMISYNSQLQSFTNVDLTFHFDKAYGGVINVQHSVHTIKVELYESTADMFRLCLEAAGHWQMEGRRALANGRPRGTGKWNDKAELKGTLEGVDLWTVRDLHPEHLSLLFATLEKSMEGVEQMDLCLSPGVFDIIYLDNPDGSQRPGGTLDKNKTTHWYGGMIALSDAEGCIALRITRPEGTAEGLSARMSASIAAGDGFSTPSGAQTSAVGQDYFPHKVDGTCLKVDEMCPFSVDVMNFFQGDEGIRPFAGGRVCEPECSPPECGDFYQFSELAGSESQAERCTGEYAEGKTPYGFFPYNGYFTALSSPRCVSYTVLDLVPGSFL
eukprot:gene17128-20365_t